MAHAFLCNKACTTYKAISPNTPIHIHLDLHMRIPDSSYSSHPKPLRILFPLRVDFLMANKVRPTIKPLAAFRASIRFLPSVDSLVADQVRAAIELLPAIRAFVRLFPCVDSLVHLEA